MREGARGARRHGRRIESGEPKPAGFLPVVIRDAWQRHEKAGVSVTTASGTRIEGLSSEVAVSLVAFLEWSASGRAGS